MKKTALIALLMIAVLAVTGCSPASYEELNIAKYVTLGTYKGLSYEAVDTAVSDYELTVSVNKDLQAKGYEETKTESITSGVVQIGDTCNIDFKGLKDGVAFEGGTASGYSLEIGSGSFIAGFEEGVFPSYRAAFESGEIEEERRLCYVALTRAKAHLYLTHAQTRTLMGATTRNRVSRFMLDIPESLYTAEGVDVTVHSVDIAPPPIRQCGPAHFGTTITSKPMVPRPAAVANCDLSPGDTVRHKKFGEGTVLSAVPVGNDTKLEINFLSAGKKTLLATYAKLEKLQ